MRAVRVAIVLILGGTSLRSGEPDHLLPLDRNKFAKYRTIVNEKLGQAPYDCGRVIVRPAFDPEYSISVYSNPDSHNGDGYRVTYVVADHSIWQQTDIGREPNELKGIKFHKIEANIPKPIAELMKAVWTAMLSDPKLSQPTPAPKIIPMDGTYAEYSITQSRGPVLYGELCISVPPSGSRTRDLVWLTDALVEYCKGSPEQRKGLMPKIEKTGIGLLGSFRKAAP